MACRRQHYSQSSLVRAQLGDVSWTQARVKTRFARQVESPLGGQTCLSAHNSVSRSDHNHHGSPNIDQCSILGHMFFPLKSFVSPSTTNFRFTIVERADCTYHRLTTTSEEFHWRILLSRDFVLPATRRVRVRNERLAVCLFARHRTARSSPRLPSKLRILCIVMIYTHQTRVRQTSVHLSELADGSNEDEENCDCRRCRRSVDEALVARAFPRLAGAARRARAASTVNPLAGDTRARLSDAEHAWMRR